jgi:ABC-2 type transport system ATP-binding protein
MRVREYLSFCAGLKRIPATEKSKEISRVMELLKITDVKDKLIKNLSKGYKQRVGFAQALLGNPKFLILDEPTVGLDPKQVTEVRNIIKDLKKDHSVIFSSHILSEVSAVCDRVVIINKGDIKAIDTIENLEKQTGGSLILHIRTKGSRATASEIIQNTQGVKEITKVNVEGDEAYEFIAQLEGDGDAIKNSIMKDLLNNNVQITEIFTEKPDLEAAFVKLINSKTSGGMKELFEEYKSDILESQTENAEKEGNE